MSRRRKASVCTILPVGSNHWLHSADNYMRDAIARMQRAPDEVCRWMTFGGVQMRMEAVLIDSDKAMHAAIERLRGAMNQAQSRTALLALKRAWERFHAAELAKLETPPVVDFAEARSRFLARGWTRKPVAPDLVSTAQRRQRLAECKRVQRYASR